MLKRIQNYYQTFIDYFFPSVKKEPYQTDEGAFHHKKIQDYGIDLRNTELPIEQRAKAAVSMGLLAYTGGANAAICASEYIQDLYDIFCTQTISTKVRIQVLQGLSCICYINPKNQRQAKDLNLINILLDHLDEEQESASGNACITIQFWICYLLTVLCSSTVPCITAVHKVGGEKLEKKLKLLSHMDWSGWPNNYAAVLFSLLGFQRLQNISNV
ncbi:armadillo-like helical domain-containing protein 2 [Apteryx mantelli]|uniref:Armadillo-like helical domain-containing protein 2 n=1 Tax=Apteryx mantelli TaxID=2696672 RepID=A0ABM4E6C0_9AVES